MAFEAATKEMAHLSVQTNSPVDKPTTPPPAQNFEPPERTTLYPKITGNLEELIRNYKHRNDRIDEATQERIPGPIEDPILTFTGTVKLHGTHADIVFNPNGSIRIQSRNRLSLTLVNDNYNVAKTLLPLKTELLALKDKVVGRWKDLHPGAEVEKDTPIIIAGEWIGPSIQKNVAIAQLPQRCLVIISLSINNTWLPLQPYAALHDEKRGIYNISRGGFFTATLDVDEKQECEDRMRSLTNQVETRCPFAAAAFSIAGIGEGIVWIPDRPDLRPNTQFWLKTKGPLHRIVDREKLVPTTVAGDKREKARALAEATITEMRLQQAWDYMVEMRIGRDKEGAAKFCAWLCGDVEAEEGVEIQKLEVDVKMLRVAIGAIGKKWYFKKVNESM